MTNQVRFCGQKGNTMFDSDRLMKVMSEILSDMYDCKITLTAIPKDQAAKKEETT